MVVIELRLSPPVSKGSKGGVRVWRHLLKGGIGGVRVWHYLSKGSKGGVRGT